MKSGGFGFGQPLVTSCFPITCSSSLRLGVGCLHQPTNGGSLSSLGRGTALDMGNCSTLPCVEQHTPRPNVDGGNNHPLRGCRVIAA